MIGFGISIVYYVFIKLSNDVNINKLQIKLHKSQYFAFLSFLLCMVVASYFLFRNEEVLLKLEVTLSWAIGFLVIFFTTGEFYDPSLNSLLSHHYFHMEVSTFLFGDGYYVSPTGRGYYMWTDAGYMRNLLYFGIGGFFMLLWHQCNIIFTKRKYFYFECLLLIFVLIVHIKVDALGYASAMTKILFLRTLSILAENVDEKQKINIDCHSLANR